MSEDTPLRLLYILVSMLEMCSFPAQHPFPFVDPALMVHWNFGDSYPASTLTDAINNKTIL